MVEWMRQVIGKQPKIDDLKASFEFECGSRESRESVIACDGEEVRGSKLHISTATHKMSCEEMSDWLVEKLRHREEIETDREFWNIPQQTRYKGAGSADIKPVSFSEPSYSSGGKGKGKGKGKGRNNSPKQNQGSGWHGRGSSRERSHGYDSNATSPATQPNSTTRNQSGPATPLGKGARSDQTGGGSKNQKQHEFNWFRDCRACGMNGRDAKHGWRTCEFSKKALEKRSSQTPSEAPRTSGEKNKEKVSSSEGSSVATSSTSAH